VGLDGKPFQRAPASKQIVRFFFLCQKFQPFRRLDVHIVEPRRFLEMGLNEIRHALEFSPRHAECALSSDGVENSLAVELRAVELRDPLEGNEAVTLGSAFLQGRVPRLFALRFALYKPRHCFVSVHAPRLRSYARSCSRKLLALTIGACV
jgi:hypothetical protein